MFRPTILALALAAAVQATPRPRLPDAEPSIVGVFDVQWGKDLRQSMIFDEHDRYATDYNGGQTGYWWREGVTIYFREGSSRYALTVEWIRDRDGRWLGRGGVRLFVPQDDGSTWWCPRSVPIVLRPVVCERLPMPRE